MGVMVEKKSWDLGADIYTPDKPGDALRSLKIQRLFQTH